MGDRGNIVVRQKSGTNTDDVWLYTHWGGEVLPTALQDALKRRVRWDDEMYLPRIIFCRMIDSDVAGETGYAIGCSIGDNEHDILVVDVEAQTVFQITESALETHRLPGDLKAVMKQRWPFAEFIALTESELPEI